MSWTKEAIKQILLTRDDAVERAIVRIYERQTFDEQATEDTKHHNNVGFSCAHVKRGTYYAKWILKGRRLTGHHLDRARKIALRYAGQLADIANEKTKQ